MPNTHRRRRCDATVELSRVGVGGVNTVRNWLARTACGCVHSAVTTQLDSLLANGKSVQTRRDCRRLVANSVHTADATQLDSCVASASALCIGRKLRMPPLKPRVVKRDDRRRRIIIIIIIIIKIILLFI